MQLVVFDVGGTEIKYSLMNENLEVFDSGYVPTPMDSFETFADTIYEIYAPYRNEVDGIAMSLPGFIDVEKGRCKGGGALVYNHGTDVGPLLEKKCGCKVVLQNDGKAAAKAEFYKGSLQGCTNAAVFVIGTGVGGGIIIDKKVVRGIHSIAGEFSYLNANVDKFDKYDGYVGAICSTSGLLGMYNAMSQSEEKIDGRTFFARIEHDEIAKQTLDILASNIAKQIYNLYFLLDIEKIAIGGGISRQPILIEKINEKMKEVYESNPFSTFLPSMHVEIVQASYGNEANQIGALMTFIEKQIYQCNLNT